MIQNKLNCVTKKKKIVKEENFHGSKLQIQISVPFNGAALFYFQRLIWFVDPWSKILHVHLRDENCLQDEREGRSRTGSISRLVQRLHRPPPPPPLSSPPPRNSVADGLISCPTWTAPLSTSFDVDILLKIPFVPTWRIWTPLETCLRPLVSRWNGGMEMAKM